MRAYGQSDPVIAYKIEGHQMFEEMVHRIQRMTVVRLLKTEWVFQKPQVPEAGEMMPSAPKPATMPASNGETAQTPDASAAPAQNTAQSGAAPVSSAAPAAPVSISAAQSAFRAAAEPAVDVSKLQTNLSSGPRQPVKAKTKVGPNDPCPCGSGKKYKKCCGKNN